MFLALLWILGVVVTVPWLVMLCTMSQDAASLDVLPRLCLLGSVALGCGHIIDFNHFSCISFSRCKCWTSFRWKEGRKTPSKGSSPSCQVGERAPVTNHAGFGMAVTFVPVCAYTSFSFYLLNHLSISKFFRQCCTH